MAVENKTTVECPSCDGTGQFWQNGSPWRCNGCHGTGHLPIENQPANFQTTRVHTDDLLSAVATAIDAEVYRQYREGSEWEEAKDVLECLDYCNVASAALRALQKWEDRQ